MSKTGPLLESQETEIFKIIERDDRFAPAEFNWNRPPDPTKKSGRYVGSGFASDTMDSQTLIHDPSRSRFTFTLVDVKTRRGRTEKRHKVEFSPSQNAPEGSYPRLKWDSVLSAVRSWLDFVHREHTTVNPWEQVRAVAPEGLLPAGSRDIPKDEKFGPEEQEAVSQRLEDLEQEFRSYRDLTDEQLEVLHSEIESLREDLEEMEKWKWMKLAVGTSFNLVDVLDLDPAEIGVAIHELLEFVATLPDQLPPGLS